MLKSGVYKHIELENIMGSKMAVKRAFDSGILEKVARGFYATPDISSNKAYFLIIKRFYPEGVISKGTLLYHYGLTTYQPTTIDIDVNSNSKLRNNTDLVQIHRTNKIFSTCSLEFNSVKLKCYTMERALFEVLYFENKFGQLTSEVIHNYLAKYKYDPATIHQIAQKFGGRGRDLANLLQALAGNKFRY